MIELRRISKRFGGVTALRDVSVSLQRGRAHALIGENGAGKSTLMNVLAGLVAPDAGELRIDDQPVRLRNAADAARRGIAMVHQELNLVEELSVAENITLGREPTRRGLIDRRRAAQIAREALARIGADLSPATAVKRLSIAQQQMVEIAKALAADARVLILDEPTAVLTRPEAQRLLTLIDELRRGGVAIVYVSHLLAEVMQIADQVTVLRDGAVVASLGRDQLEGPGQLARLMVGRALRDHYPERGVPRDETALSVRSAGARFEVRRGEVFGLAGLIGAGRTELAEAIVGLRADTAVETTLNDERLRKPDVRDALRAGVAYLSEDRRGRGLVMPMGIADNITLPTLRRFGRVLIDRRAQLTAARRHVASLHIAAAGLDQPVATLSGGNQQKVAIARWLQAQPHVLILDEPTRGVDVGAKEEIFRIIHDLAARGLAIVMISSELPDLLGMCHRIGVMRGGRLAATLDGSTATEAMILGHAAGVALEHAG